MQETVKNPDRKSHNHLSLLTLIIGCMAWGSLAFYLYQQKIVDAILQTGLLLLICGCGFFMTGIRKSEGKCFRFRTIFLAWFLGMFLSLFFPVIPFTVWPIVPLFVMMSFLAGPVAGMLYGTGFLYYAAALNTCNLTQFLVYFISGVIAIWVFDSLDEQFQFGPPLFLTELTLFLMLSVGIVLQKSLPLDQEIIILTVANLMITALLILILLKFYSRKSIHVRRDLYLELNDPESDVLKRLREASKKDYYESIHVAYFCERIAVKLGLDSRVLKAAGYYHRLGALAGENTWDNLFTMGTEIGLPEEVLTVLEQVLNKNVPLTDVSAAILYFSDQIIAGILYLFEQNPEIKLDYRKLVDMIFSQKIEQGVLSSCDISFSQIEQMKTIFAQEKLYYDFLR